MEREGTYVGRREKKRRKNSIDNVRSDLPLSSCYFSHTRKILHSCTKEEKLPQQQSS